MLIVVLWLVLMGAAATPCDAQSRAATAQDPLAGITPADVELGRRLFQNNCVVCHGFDATGGTGPSLAGAKLHRAADNAALIELITDGIENRGMPPSWHLLPNGPRLVAAYVRSLGQLKETPVAGNVEHGRSVYRKSGCGGCHIVNGAGTSLGPELTDVSLRRTAGLLRTKITRPESAVSQGFLMLRVQPRGEPEVTGVRLNEDSFTIQLKDAYGKFHSFQKANLVMLEKQSGKTLMPAYANSLAGQDLDDLVAYLKSLRGAQ